MNAPTPDTNQPESDKQQPDTELRQKLADLIRTWNGRALSFEEVLDRITPAFEKAVATECQAARIDELELIDERGGVVARLASLRSASRKKTHA